MKFSKIIGILGFLAMASVAPSALMAQEVNPMVMELKPSGQGSTRSGVIRNTQQVPIAIEIKIYDRKQKPDGTDELVPEENDVIVTPPQMVIRPGESQTFRVRWVGEPDPSQELAYRLVTHQLPIRFKKEQRNDFTAEVTLRYRYEVALYIQPDGTTPKATLQSARVFNDEKHGKLLEVAISSDGTRRAILENPSLDLTAGGASYTLNGETLAPLVGLNILPGNTRIVTMPAPAELPFGEMTGSLKATYLVVS